MAEMYIWEQLKSESLSTEQGSQRQVIVLIMPINNVSLYNLILIHILKSSWLHHGYIKVFKYFKI